VSALDKACGQGYTQQDVTQVAEVLTGWTIAPAVPRRRLRV